MQTTEEIGTGLLLSTKPTQQEVKTRWEEERDLSFEDFEEPEKLVSRKGPRVVKNSPFYQVLTDLQSEHAASVIALNMEDTTCGESRQVFFIHLEALAHSPLFQGLRLKNRHFSIDKVYKTSKELHGYTPIHYTETYTSKEMGESIIVHVYLNGQGQCVDQKIKKIKKADKPKDLKISAEQQALLETNINTSAGLIHFLFGERRERYLAEKAKTDKLELELLEISRSLGKEGVLDSYIKKVREIITALENLNKYTEIPDTRTKYFLTVLANLSGWSDRIKKAGKAVLKRSSDLTVKKEPVEEPLAPETELLPSKELQVQDTQQAIYNSAIEQLKELEGNLADKLEYSVKTLDEIKKRHLFCEKADVLLMVVLFEFPDSLLKAKGIARKTGEITGRISSHIKQHRESGLKLLQKEALKGNSEAVQELFPLFGDKLEEKFYQKLLKSLVYAKSTDSQRLMKICEFFNLNSESYRNTVFKASKEQRYVLSKEEVTALREKVIFPSVSAELSNRSLEVSLLFKVYCDGNLAVFEMLLQHQADPNAWAVVKKDAPLWGFSIFNVIPFLATPDYFSYLKLLLRHHADSDLAMTKTQSHLMNVGKLEFQKDMRRKGKQPKGSLSESRFLAMATGGSPIPPLLFSVFLQNVRPSTELGRSLAEFKFLLSHTSAKTIAYCFSTIVSMYKFDYIMYLETSHRGIQFSDSRELATKKAGADKKAYSFLLAYTIFRMPEQIIEFNILKLMYQRLTSELEKMDPKIFDFVYETLYSLGFEQGARGNYETAYNFFIACQHFLLTRCSTLKSQEEQAELLKTYCSKLCRELSKILPQILKNNDLQTTLAIYKAWMSNTEQVYRRMKKSNPMNLLIPSSELKADLESRVTNLLFEKEFGITTPDSETPILGTLSVRKGYAIVIFHPSRTCFIHWDDNVNRNQLAFVVDKFLNNKREPKIFEILQKYGFKGPELDSLYEYLGGPALSAEECQVTIIGGWKDYERSKQNGVFVKDFFGKIAVKSLNLTAFLGKAKEHAPSVPVDSVDDGRGFYFVTVDSRSGYIRGSDNWVDCRKIKYSSPIPFLKQRSLCSEYLDSIHLQQDIYPRSGTKLIASDDFSEISRYEANQLCKLARAREIKKLKEFLDIMVIEINTSPETAQGWTALHYACAIGHFDCAEILISHGADPSLPNKQGKSALDLIPAKDKKEWLDRLKGRWEARKILSEKQGSQAGLQFALYERHREQLMQANLEEMQKIETRLQTSTGQKELSRMLDSLR